MVRDAVLRTAPHHEVCICGPVTYSNLILRSPPKAGVSKDGRMTDDAKLPIAKGLACRCPRCGRGRLFQGFLNLRPRCDNCGLDYGFADAGDGPAVFIILIAGFIVVGCALIVEFNSEPPLWLHAVLWLPLILATTLLPLRSMKGLMVALQYHHRAAEGRADSGTKEIER